MFRSSAWIVHRTKLSLLIIFLVYTALTVAAMAGVDPTVDETKYLNVGRVILDAGWDHELTRQHPPLAYYCNQIFGADLPRGGILRQEMTAEVMFWGRLGLLPFGWIAGALVFMLARGVYGTNAGLFALACFALNPLMIGYSALLVVDMAYLAGTLLALHQLWRYWLQPDKAHALTLGIALGLALSTKYLTLLIAPVLLLSAAFRNRRLGSGLATLTGVGCIALLTLHASYGFAGGTASLDPTAYTSTLVNALIETPGINWLLALFPAPFLLGVDFQLGVNDSFTEPFLNGAFASRHWDYYLWCFWLKTPDWILLLSAWMLLRKIFAWTRGEAGERERALAWTCIPSLLILLTYLSLIARIQIGIRYILPLYGLLFVLLGATLQEPWLRSLSRRKAASLCTLVLALAIYDLGSHWPNLIGYYNTASGGQAEGYRHFRDSNSDWGQLRKKGRSMLRETESEELEFLEPGQGPRFGTVAIYLTSLIQKDPENPLRAHHWLDPFKPVRHVGAAWWVYECTPEDWEVTVLRTGDPRLRAELVVAYLGDGRLAKAGKHLDQLPQERAEALRPLLAVLQSRQGREPSDQEALITAQYWFRAGRFDHAADLLRRHGSVETRGMLAQSLSNQGRDQEAIALLQAASTKSSGEILSLATLYQRVARNRDAMNLLAQHMAEFSEQERRLAERLLTSARSLAEFRELIH